jgi:hypothetical protein
MTNWLNIAGGAAKGYVEGDQDNQRRAEFNFMQNQRARTLKQQKTDDDMQAQVAGIRTPGEYTDEEAVATDADQAAGVSTGPGAGIKTKKTKVTQSGYDRKVADTVGRGGRMQDIQAASQLRAQADQADDREYQARTRQVTEVLMNAGRMNKVNPLAAARYLAQSYSQVPDGHEIVIEDRNGTPHIAIAAGGKYVSAPQPLTREAINDMIVEGLQFTSMDAMKTMRTLAQGDRQVATGERVAATGEKRAGTESRLADSSIAKDTYQTTGPGGQAKLGLDAAHAGYYNAAAAQQRSAGAAGRQTAGQKMEEQIDAYATAIMAANPGMSSADARLHAARVVTRDPTAKPPTDVGLAEAGMLRINGKLYERDKNGALVEVMLPEDEAKLAEAIAARLGAKKAEPKKPMGVTPPSRPGLAQVVDEREAAKPKRERETDNSVNIYP